MDYNLWQELILGATKPFRVGANVLGQNWGSALTGKDMSQRENQGQFLKWLAGGITPEEQTAINEKPYLEAIKSSAGMASTLAPFATQSLRTAQLASNPVTNKFAQLLSQGALEGGLGGFGYSREGKEIEDTLTGMGLGAAGEVAFEALRNPSFRKMLGEAGTYVDPSTGRRMYKGAVGGVTEDQILGMRDRAFRTLGDIEGIENDLARVYAGNATRNPLHTDIEVLQRAPKTVEGFEYLQFLLENNLVDPQQLRIPMTAYRDELLKMGADIPNVIDLQGLTPTPERIAQIERQLALRRTPTAVADEGRRIIMDADAIKYPTGKPIVDPEDMKENLKRIVRIIDNR